MQWVLHHDVSDGNSMLLVWNISAESTIPPHPKNVPEGWTSIRDGMTSDWGSAVDYTDLAGEEHLPYTLIIGGPVHFHHDLQSYFWLAYLITCNCGGPFNMYCYWDGEIKLFNQSRSIKPADIQHMAEIKTYGKVLDPTSASLLTFLYSENPFALQYLS
ncbi:hypothetical protein BD769DRAFT_1360331 [Suillus cothurnatus]|nr:hypothetical protein BD769DRAFT_1360331 [Suillus cothurnatus]